MATTKKANANVTKKAAKVTTKSEDNPNNTRNVILKDVEIWWAKLNPSKPVSPFGEEQWECQVRVPKKRKDELAELDFSQKQDRVQVVKDDSTKVGMNFRKKAQKKDGSPAMPIKVVSTHKDEDGEPIQIDPRTIGNGSKGNVKLMLRDWEMRGRSGTVVTLQAIQLTDHKVYEPRTGEDFDFDDEEEAPKAKAPAKSKKQVEDDDDIPF